MTFTTRYSPDSTSLPALSPQVFRHCILLKRCIYVDCVLVVFYSCHFFYPFLLLNQAFYHLLPVPQSGLSWSLNSRNLRVQYMRKEDYFGIIFTPDSSDALLFSSSHDVPATYDAWNRWEPSIIIKSVFPSLFFSAVSQLLRRLVRGCYRFFFSRYSEQSLLFDRVTAGNWVKPSPIDASSPMTITDVNVTMDEL